MKTAADVLMNQIAILVEARDAIIAAIDSVTGSVDPDAATWADVGRLAALVDAVKRAELA